MTKEEKEYWEAIRKELPDLESAIRNEDALLTRVTAFAIQRRAKLIELIHIQEAQEKNI